MPETEARKLESHIQPENHAEALWYALRVRSKCEKVVAGGLGQRDIVYYLPLFNKKRQWSDRVKTIHVPLFSGYVFAEFNRMQMALLVTIPGFMYIVGRGDVPESLASSEIEAVRRVVDDGIGVEPWPFCEAGVRVEVIRGPMAGLQGVYLRSKSEDRLIISLPLLQRAISTEIESYNVRLIPEAKSSERSGTVVNSVCRGTAIR